MNDNPNSLNLEDNKPASSMAKLSIVILTFNRPDLLKKLLSNLKNIQYSNIEVIVVDNASDRNIETLLQHEFPNVIFLTMKSNLGAVGRNVGIDHATGELIITLDDDILGINDNDLAALTNIFKDEKVGASCFKVIDSKSSKVINWCHHYSVEEFSDKVFLTNEITEGAVAFRKETLDESGLYPDRFFISHEGPDLAYRIMNSGYNVIYNPAVEVKHFTSPLGRKSWRRYYYDTRNIMWLAARNQPVPYAIKFCTIGLGAMFVYSARDGFIRYWIKGIIDSLRGLPQELKNRKTPTQRTNDIIKTIDNQRPGFFYMVKRRLFTKDVQI